MSFEMACIFTGRETDNAVQIQDPVDEEKYWIPLSQVEEMHRGNLGVGPGTIKMTDWIAQKKRLA